MSLDRLTEAQAEALVRLQRSDDFSVFMSLLGQEMHQLNERLIRTDTSDSEEKKIIGQLRLGTRLTDAVVKSEDTLQQHRKPKS